MEAAVGVGVGAERLRGQAHPCWSDGSGRRRAKTRWGHFECQTRVSGSNSLGSGEPEQEWESWRMGDGGSGLQEGP